MFSRTQVLLFRVRSHFCHRETQVGPHVPNFLSWFSAQRVDKHLNRFKLDSQVPTLVFWRASETAKDLQTSKVHSNYVQMHQQNATALEAPASEPVQSRPNCTTEQETTTPRRELKYDMDREPSTELCGPESPFRFKTVEKVKR